MSKFSKETWITSGASQIFPDRDVRGYEIKIQRSIEDSISLSESKEIAHLIAAAPDMHRLLERMLLDDGGTCFLSDIENVLSKARGLERLK